MPVTTETATFRAVISEGEKALYEWEGVIADRSVNRFMNESRERTLSKAFQSDGRFLNAAMIALLNPNLTHRSLMDVYRGGDDFAWLTKRVLSDPTWLPDMDVLPGVDADLKRLADDAVDKTRMGAVWSMRAFIAWLQGDVDAAKTRLATSLFLSQGDDTLGILMRRILEWGIGVGGRNNTPVHVDA